MVSPKTPKTLRSQACLLFCFARRFPGSLDQELIKRSSAGITIQRVCRLLELDALKQPLDITGDSICGHDECQIASKRDPLFASNSDPFWR